MKILVNQSITITNPTPTIEKYFKTKLTVSNPEYNKLVRMNKWIGDTPSVIRLYHTKFGDLILPYGCLSELLGMLSFDELMDIRYEYTDNPTVEFDMEIPLYNYQVEAVDAMASKLVGILNSPAGSGKTQCGLAIINKLGLRALWLTHTQDLLNQSRDRVLQFMPNEGVGTITSGKVDIGSKITFATVQTLAKQDMSNFRDCWDVLIVDECHRVCSTATSVGMFGKVINNINCKHKYGLSATLHRADGLITSTFAILGGVAHTVPDEAVADKIMRVSIHPVVTDGYLDDCCTNPDGTLNFNGLITHLCTIATRNTNIVDNLVDNVENSQLVLSHRVEHLETIRDMLPPNIKVKTVLIHGKMTSKKAKLERQQAIEDMRSGEKTILFATYNLAKEGLDIPRLDRLHLTTPHKDYAIITQSVGRIARTFDGKADPIVLDYVDIGIPYLRKSYKKRLTHYKKLGANIP